jgi:hypothetical protein
VEVNLDLAFTNSEIKFPEGGSAETLVGATSTAILPTLVNVAFELGTSALETRYKKFTSEYSIQKSNLNAANKLVPEFILERNLVLKKTTEFTNALKIGFRVKEVPIIDSNDLESFIFFIDEILLYYSSAIAESEESRFDYIIEIKPTFLFNKEKKSSKPLAHCNLIS